MSYLLLALRVLHAYGTQIYMQLKPDKYKIMKIKYLRDCECSPIDGASISLPLRLREHIRRKIEKNVKARGWERCLENAVL